MTNHESPFPPALRVPVSVKGIVIVDGRVLLLKNERDEWELPGGKIELGESPEECVAREVEEEVGWRVEVDLPTYAWMYEVKPAHHVFVLCFGCTTDATEPPVVSDEHREVFLADLADVATLNMPEGYKIAIARWVGVEARQH
ncbi:MAG: NUDIX domain-containing protein [Frankiaceae bacterium]|nr:NUDIX domain-containing protein [Frankiaceae bacterium]